MIIKIFILIFILILLLLLVVLLKEVKTKKTFKDIPDNSISRIHVLRYGKDEEYKIKIARYLLFYNQECTTKEELEAIFVGINPLLSDFDNKALARLKEIKKSSENYIHKNNGFKNRYLNLIKIFKSFFTNKNSGIKTQHIQ